MGEKRIIGIAAMAWLATFRQAMAIISRRIMSSVKSNAWPATPHMRYVMYSNAAAFSSAPVRSTEAPEASTASETPASSMSPAFLPQYAVTAMSRRWTPTTVAHALTPAEVPQEHHPHDGEHQAAAEATEGDDLPRLQQVLEVILYDVGVGGHRAEHRRDLARVLAGVGHVARIRERRDLLLRDRRRATVHDRRVRHEHGVARPAEQDGGRHVRSGELRVVARGPLVHVRARVPRPCRVVAHEAVVGEATRDRAVGAVLHAHALGRDQRHGGVLRDVHVHYVGLVREIRRRRDVIALVAPQLVLHTAQVAAAVEAVVQQVGVAAGDGDVPDRDHAAPEGGEDEAEEHIRAPAALFQLCG